MTIMKFKWMAYWISLDFTGLLVFESFVYNTYNLNFYIKNDLCYIYWMIKFWSDYNISDFSR